MKNIINHIFKAKIIFNYSKNSRSNKKKILYSLQMQNFGKRRTVSEALNIKMGNCQFKFEIVHKIINGC